MYVLVIFIQRQFYCDTMVLFVPCTKLNISHLQTKHMNSQ